MFFHGIPVQHAPDTGEPQQTVDVSVTGFGASENVNVKLDGTTELTMATDQWGSADGSLLLDTTFGRHSISFVGTSSGVVRNKSILLKQWVNLDPNSGPTGTVVHVTSGPGWKPGERVQVKVGGAARRHRDGRLERRRGHGRDDHPEGRSARSTCRLTGLSLKLTAMADFTITG